MVDLLPINVTGHRFRIFLQSLKRVSKLVYTKWKIREQPEKAVGEKSVKKLLGLVIKNDIRVT